MKDMRTRSGTEQVADHLREEIQRGALTGTMPGTAKLARELGVGMRIVAGALEQLEAAGLLVNQGRRRKRRIEAPADAIYPSLRIVILPYEKRDEKLHYMVDLIHNLREAGHIATFSSKSLLDLRMDLGQIQRHVERTKADAWVIGSGSRSVLEWFAQRQEHAFALMGRRRGFRIASSGPDKLGALRDLVRRLVDLGHRRIVLLAREERRNPFPAAFEQAFLDQLNAHDIPTSAYNLPHWHHQPGGLQHCLDSLFSHTPPTALIIEEMPFFFSVMQHLASRGVIAPRDVSLVCDDPSTAFDWSMPSVAHIGWTERPLIRRVVKWADNVARGIDDRLQSFVRAKFVDGGTIGPAPKGK
jgi:DNA-binding transcriptional regulator YhcF (GntR family)